MALLLTLQLLFYILVIFPFAVALPVGNSAFSLPNDVSLGFDSSFSFLDGTAQLDPIKREFSPRRPLPITTNAKANVLSERSRGATRPLEKPEEKVNLMTKACEHVVRVDKPEKPQSARRSPESLAPPHPVIPFVKTFYKTLTHSQNFPICYRHGLKPRRR